MPEFVPALPGSWSVAGQPAFDLVNHEAAHAVVAWSLGLEIRWARIDRPDSHIAGEVRTVADFDKIPEHLIATLAGSVMDRTPIQWPPSSKAQGDEKNAAILVELLDYDEEQWDLAVTAASRILELPQVVKALTALTRSLLELGAVPGDEVTRVLEDTLALPPEADLYPVA